MFLIWNVSSSSVLMKGMTYFIDFAERLYVSTINAENRQISLILKKIKWISETTIQSKLGRGKSSGGLPRFNSTCFSVKFIVLQIFTKYQYADFNKKNHIKISKANLLNVLVWPLDKSPD